jgi:hypothetical protein
MTTRSHWWTYLIVFGLSAILSIVVVGTGQMTIDNLSCRSTKYRDHDFLAYCGSDKYGDYEHGALYYGSEPSIRDSIRSAKVIFLGSSRTQAGFSTMAVRAYFDKLDIRFFVMGFGYGEVSPFSLAVLKRWKASPKVVVINADPFFVDVLSEPAKEALEGRPAFLWRLTLKTLFQRVHRVLCAAPYICSQGQPAIFRSAIDGQWNWIGPYTEERAVPVDRVGDRTLSSDEFERAKELGNKFLQEIGLSRRCVILTGTPNTYHDSVGIAKVLAAALGTRSIFPSGDGLATLDGGHLNLASAERWSGQFVEELTPILKECIAGGQKIEEHSRQ